MDSPFTTMVGVAKEDAIIAPDVMPKGLQIGNYLGKLVTKSTRKAAFNDKTLIYRCYFWVSLV